MIIKIGIIAGVLILATMIIINETDFYTPTTTAAIVGSLQDNISNIESQTSEFVEYIDEPLNQAVQKTTGSITTGLNETNNKLSSQIGEISLPALDPIKSIRDLFSGI